jgi:hypothetical protein
VIRTADDIKKYVEKQHSTKKTNSNSNEYKMLKNVEADETERLTVHSENESHQDNYREIKKEIINAHITDEEMDKDEIGDHDGNIDDLKASILNDHDDV